MENRIVKILSLVLIVSLCAVAIALVGPGNAAFQEKMEMDTLEHTAGGEDGGTDSYSSEILLMNDPRHIDGTAYSITILPQIETYGQTTGEERSDTAGRPMETEDQTMDMENADAAGQPMEAQGQGKDKSSALAVKIAFVLLMTAMMLAVVLIYNKSKNISMKNKKTIGFLLVSIMVISMFAVVPLGEGGDSTNEEIMYTDDTADITESTAVLRGEISNVETVGDVDVSFEWGLEPGSPYAHETDTSTMSSSGSVEFTIDGLAPKTTYYYRMKAVSEDEIYYGRENSFTTPLENQVFYVHQAAPSGGDGSSWENAFTNIEDAFEAADSTDEILVALSEERGDSSLALRLNKSESGEVLVKDIIDVGPSQILEGSGTIDSDVVISGTHSPGHSPGIDIINGDYTVTGTLQIEIGGVNPGPGAPNPTDPDYDKGYDQVQVTGNVQLGGTLEVVLINDFVPVAGQTFDFILLTGTGTSISEKFADATGLYGFGDGNLYFEIVEKNDRMQLEVKEIPGGSDITIDVEATSIDEDINLGMTFSAYFSDSVGVTISNGKIAIHDYFYLSGSFSLDLDPQETVKLKSTPSEQVNVRYITIGVKIDHAFAGANGPYWTEDTDGDGVMDEDETNPEAVGLSLTDVELGLALFQADTTNPNDKRAWIGLKGHASSVEFVGVENLTIEGSVAVDINTGCGTKDNIENKRVVDFPESFTPDGLEVNTGDGTPVLLDFDSEYLKVEGALTLNIFGFFYIDGTFAFEKGPVVKVDVATGLPANLGDQFQTLFDALAELIYFGAELVYDNLPEFIKTWLSNNGYDKNNFEDGVEKWKEDNLYIDSNLSMIHNVKATITQIGVSNARLFIGDRGPYWTDVNGDGEVNWLLPDGTILTDDMYFPDPDDYVDVVTYTDPVTGEETDYGDIDKDNIKDANETAELSTESTGLWVEEVDMGFVTMTPKPNQIPLPSGEDPPTFYALKAETGNIAMVGMGEYFELSAEKTTVTVNDGDPWPFGLGPPVVDFTSSFPAEEAGQDPDNDGKTGEPEGFEILTGGEPMYIDWDGNQRIGATATGATLKIYKILHLTGNVGFEMGPALRVNVSTNFPADLWNLIGGTFFETALEDLQAALGLGDDLSTFENVDVTSLQVGGSNLNAFLGWNAP
ncbi:MAG: fibronectin type III domain-containing protein, partial [Thermoplasmata archaeon]